MNKRKCEVCGSSHTVKNGVRKGVQLYKCQECGYQFRAGVEVSDAELWNAYQQEKQTIRELSERYGKSVSTIKRRLHAIKREWRQPSLSGSGFVHMDVTYWGRNFGVLLALDNQTGKPLYMAFVKSETVKDYEDAISSIKDRGYSIRGLIIDGKQSLFKTFSYYPIQMCQFHMKQIVRRYLTLSPKMHASRELKDLVNGLHRADGTDFRKKLPGMEGEVEGHDSPQESPQGREDALYASAVEGGYEQPELLSALSLHLPTRGLQGNAQHEQQD